MKQCDKTKDQDGGGEKHFSSSYLLRVLRIFANGHKGCQGVTAIEFALILPIFAYFLVGILEVSLLFFTSVIVDGAAQDAARKIRTGQAQLSGNAFTAFQNEICGSVFTYDCNNMTYDVKTFTTFSAVSLPILHLDADGNLVDEFDNPYTPEFTVGGPGAISVVRVIYPYDFFTPLIGGLLGDSNNSRLMSTTAVFRNEPYE